MSQKFKHLKILVVLSLIFGGASSILFSSFSGKKPSELVAESKKIYLSAGDVWDHDDAWFAVYGYHNGSITIPNNNNTKVYLFNYWNYSTPYCYAFSPSELFGGWPGKAMTKVGSATIDSDTRDVYCIDFPSAQSNVSLIFSDNSKNQTKNIENVKAPFCAKQESSITITSYTGKIESWVKLDKVDECVDTHIYSGSVNDADTLIFTRMDKNKSSLSWDSVWNQTYDLNGIPSGKDTYKIDSQPPGQNAEGSWHIFNASGDNVEYAFGNYGVKNQWSLSSAIKLVNHGDSELKTILPLKANDEFRFYVNSVLDPNYDESSKIVVKSESPIKATKVNNNIKMPSDLIEGAYIIYWSYADSNWGLYITTSNDTSDSLSLFINQYDTEGQCVEKFGKCRTRFLAMDSSEQSIFKTSAENPESPAYRYVQWARSLGEDPWSNGKAVNSPGLFRTGVNADSVIWIISLISIIGAVAVGGYFFYRRRKEN